MTLINKYYSALLNFNKVHLNAGIVESIEVTEKKKTETSVFATIFKYCLSISIFLAMGNYILFGPDGFKIPKYQNMQSASTKK